MVDVYVIHRKARIRCEDLPNNTWLCGLCKEGEVAKSYDLTFTWVGQCPKCGCQIKVVDRGHRISPKLFSRPIIP